MAKSNPGAAAIAANNTTAMQTNARIRTSVAVLRTNPSLSKTVAEPHLLVVVSLNTPLYEKEATH